MRLLFLIFITLTITSFSLTGCRENVTDSGENPSVPVNSAGAYVISRGNVTFGTSKLSFYNLIADTLYENIFQPTTLGIFPTGMMLNSGKLYLLESGTFGSTGVMYVLNEDGVVQTYTAAGSQPYMLAIANNKIYITNGSTNSVLVLNASTLEQITNIPVVNYPQEIISVGNKLFVCNAGSASNPDSAITVIDASTDAVIRNFNVRKTPTSMATTLDGKILIGCRGVSTNGIIYKVDPQTYGKIDSFYIASGFASGFDRDISVDPQSDYIYFISYLNNVCRLNTATKSVSVFIPNSGTSSNLFYGYKYDPSNRLHYIANAKNFTSNGALQKYNSSGALVESYTTGIVPSRIVVK